MDIQIEAFIQQKGKILAKDIDIYRNSLEDHLQESTFKIKTWVILNTPLITQSIKEKKKKEKSYDIRKFCVKQN